MTAERANKGIAVLSAGSPSLSR